MYIDNCEELNLQTDLVDKVLFDDNNIYVFKAFDLEENFFNLWNDTQSYVAGSIQANLSEHNIDEKLAWNIYLIFIVSFHIEKNIVNKIQADKYCCKKYILKVSDITNLDEVKATINKEIPLFSTFNFSVGNSVSSIEQEVKQEIVNRTNNSLLANEFLSKENISNITSNESIDQFIEELKEVYDEN